MHLGMMAARLMSLATVFLRRLKNGETSSLSQFRKTDRTRTRYNALQRVPILRNDLLLENAHFYEKCFKSDGRLGSIKRPFSDATSSDYHLGTLDHSRLPQDQPLFLPNLLHNHIPLERESPNPFLST